MRKIAFCSLFLAFCSVSAFADSTVVTFPLGSPDSYYWSAGDTVSSDVFTGIPFSSVNGLTENWTYSNHLASDATETWDILLNGTLVGTETLTGAGCNFCQTDMSLTNSFTFSNIDAVSGGYQISLVLQNSVYAGGGSVAWDVDGATTLSDSASVSATPEPSSILLLATGLIALGFAARKYCTV